MRIAYLNPGGQMGGAETSLREILAGIRAAEPDWEVWLVLGEDGPLARIAKGLGVQVVVAPFPAALARLGDAGQKPAATMVSFSNAVPGTALYTRKLAAKLKEIGPDLIHTNGFKMHMLGVWAAPRSTPVVWHIHDYVRSRRFMSRLVGRFSKRCTAAVTNSKSVAADLRLLCPDLKIVPIYNAIDLDRFSPTGTKMDLDRAAGLPPAVAGTVRVGLVGTFARWKGHKIFLEALSHLGAGSAVRGYIVGAPIYQTKGSQWSIEELREEAARCGLSARVGFTGFVEDIPAAMRSLDVVVHASTEPEPFGMVIIEAMACGKPVIVSRAGGAVELYEEEQTALGHAPGDANELARQIERLAADASLRAKLGEAARRVVARSFHTRRLAGDLAGLYRECHGLGSKRVAFVPSLNA